QGPIEFRTLKFLNYRSWNDNVLATLSKIIKIQGIESIGSTKEGEKDCYYRSHFHANGIAQLLNTQSLLSPFRLKIDGLRSKLVTNETLQQMLDKGIKTNFLNLHSIKLKQVSSEKFCQFVKDGGLESPCHLELTNCKFFTRK